jgi:hypothetical protein
MLALAAPIIAVVWGLEGAPAADARHYVVDGTAGPAFLTTSRSRAIGHGFKPMARFGLRLEVRPRLELGAAISALVDGNEHYRVLGALAHGRFALWQRPTFSLGVALALGAGYDADILHGDLRGGSGVLPYGFVAVDGRWLLLGRGLVGVEAGAENLSIIRLGVLIGFLWEGRSVQPEVARR